MVNVIVHMEKVVHLPIGVLTWNSQMSLPKLREQFGAMKSELTWNVLAKKAVIYRDFKFLLTLTD